MDPITQQVVLATAGAAGAGDATYVDDVFSTFLYDGTGSTITVNNGLDLSGEGGLVWLKRRTTSIGNNILVDTERGAGKWLRSNSDGNELTTSGTVTAFSSDGFTIGNYVEINRSGDTNVAWSFRKAPGFFDVVTYTGSGSAKTVSHNLGSVPGMIIIKRTNSDENWATYHRTQGATKTCRLNGDFSFSTSSSTFNNTEPTSTVFTVGTNSEVNSENDTFVAYLFAHDDQSFGTDGDEAIIKCGSYTTDGSGGATVDLGFEPQWILNKPSSGSGSWYIRDVMRGMPVDGDNAFLFPNTNGTEPESSFALRPNSSGFTAFNHAASQTNIYMAIRRPHKPATAGTDVFAIDNQGTGTMPPQYHSNFVVDWALTVAFGESQAYRDRQAYTRLLGKKMKKINESGAESNFSSAQWDYMNGWYNNNSSVSTTYSWMFRRAPGFFDVVGYSGTGLARTVSHNLGAVPSVVLITSRNGTFGWYWQHYALGKDTFMQLNNSEGAGSNGGVFDSTLPTSSVFSLPGGDLGGSNGSSYNYVAYLFADLDGISKAGTYTGTGNNINVDCGFSAGARFVIIKKKGTSTSDTGDWYVWDSTRGIVSGNDPYFLMNTDDAEVTGTDYIDPLNAGFTVTSSAPAALNTSGGTYLFLAIA
tara:strand:+ start:768 stop:2699 length:1932 start_codon:yes stop_codon:yes gene_type:complete